MKKIEKYLYPNRTKELSYLDDMIYGLAFEVAKKSTYKLKVGCVICTKDIGAEKIGGFNSFPKSLIDQSEYTKRKLKDKICLSAVKNALMNAINSHTDIRNGRVFITEPVTATDAAMLIQAEITEVVMPLRTGTTNRYFEDMKLGYDLLNMAGIKTIVVEK